jgi:hypothetical protein
VRSIVRKLALVAMIAFLTGCAAPPPTRVEALQPPQDLLQLIEAIWRINRSGLILRDQFYTVDNLKRAFGGSDVELQTGKSDVLIGTFQGEIRGFPSWMPPQATEPLKFRRLTIHPDGDLDASINLRCPCPQVRRADVERLFGKNWKQEPHVIMRHGLAEELPMRPDANMSMVYSSGDRRSGWTASFAFGADGALTNMSVESHQLKQ